MSNARQIRSPRGRSEASRRSARALAVFVLTSALVACGSPDRPDLEDPSVAETEAAEVGLTVITEPPLERLEPAVRSQLARALADVRELGAKDDVTRDTLAQAYGDLGRSYHAYEFFDAARSSYLNAAHLAPSHPHWPYFLGHVNRAMNRLEEASSAFDRALELAPDTILVLVNAARVRREMGRLDDAEELVRRALDKDPEAVEAHLLLAELAGDRENFSEAIESYEMVLRLQPQATRIYQPLAMAYRSLGDPARAQDLLKLRGDNPVKVDDLLLDGLVTLKTGGRFDLTVGNAAFQSGDLETAVAAFRQAAERNPTDLQARINLGSALLRSGDAEGAAQQYRKALEIEPGHPQSHFSLGVVRAQAGDDEGAIAHYREAIALDSGYRDPRFNLANALRRQGRCSEAREHYRRLVEADPADGSARLAEATCLVIEERYAEARQHFKEALRLLPNSRTIANAGARLLAAAPSEEVRDGEQAERIARQLLRIEYKPEYSETLAMALAELGRFEEALAIQRTLLAAAEKDGVQRVVPRLRKNLERYERGEPCRDPALG